MIFGGNPDRTPLSATIPSKMKTKLQPDCLQWARQRAGLSTSDLAHKLGVKEDRVLDWEQSGELTLSQAERLASATYTPLGYLFLPKPPVEKLPVSDFRTVGTSGISQPSPALLDVVNEALRRQDWYRDYLRSNGGEALEFVGSLDLKSDTVRAADSIRTVVAWDARLRADSGTWERALSKQVDAVEDAGILVMRSGIVGNNTSRPLSVSEFRGFALSDAYAPLIFINGRDSRAAQMFTLAHELVHVWLGVSGISNLNQTYSQDIDTERFCNAVAAELLVPLKELQTRWSVSEPPSNQIPLLVRYFKVSSLVVLRRLRDANFVTLEEFARLYTDELAQFKRSASAGGGNFYQTLRARLGKRFASALVESTLEGGTAYRDAFSLLGVANSEKMMKLAAFVGGASS